MGIFDIFRSIKFGTVIAKHYYPGFPASFSLMVRGFAKPGGREMLREIFVTSEIWNVLSIGDRYDQSHIT